MRLTLVIAALLGALPLVAADPGWRLVWHDEFDKPGLPDPAKWGYEVGFVRNHEQQYYTDARLENAHVDRDGLALAARLEDYKGAKITSASLTTKGKESWRYGRIEFRAKLPRGLGIWPALWMLGDNHDQAKWPHCGEIDVMEFVGHIPDTIHGNVHNPQRYDKTIPPEKRITYGGTYPLKAPDQDFHVYAVEWDHEAITFLVDDHAYYTYHNPHTGVDAWPYDQPFYLIMNVAFGGAWGGQKGVDNAILPQAMRVSWVRVYQRPGA